MRQSTPVHWRTRLLPVISVYRFYVGVPLRTQDGFNLGTLCVIDKEPRPIDQKGIDDLKDLASVVMDQMELRLSARQAIAQAQLMAKEIDHRVTNSLQFISSMLTMQGRNSNSETASHLEMAATDTKAAETRIESTGIATSFDFEAVCRIANCDL
jgi:GAF domain-containing protein